MTSLSRVSERYKLFDCKESTPVLPDVLLRVEDVYSGDILPRSVMERAPVENHRRRKVESGRLKGGLT